jgi:hypothetical protein
MHCMAWHIIFFLKSLWSLEEFRKNPHIKIPPKSPCTNFRRLGISNNLIFIQKKILFRFWPNRPSRQPVCLAFSPHSAHRASSSSFRTEVGERPAGGFHRLPAPPRPRPPWGRYPELCTASADCFPLLPSSFRGLNSP